MKTTAHQEYLLRARSGLWFLYSRLMGCVYALGQIAMRNRAPALSSVAAIIEKDGYLLLLNRSDRYGWCLPGGIVRGDESIREALIREVREETGLLVVPAKRPFRVCSGKRGDPRWPSVCTVYCCTVTAGQLIASDEGEPAWIRLGTAPGLFAFDTGYVLQEYYDARAQSTRLATRSHHIHDSHRRLTKRSARPRSRNRQPISPHKPRS